MYRNNTPPHPYSMGPPGDMFWSPARPRFQSSPRFHSHGTGFLPPGPWTPRGNNRGPGRSPRMSPYSQYSGRSPRSDLNSSGYAGYSPRHPTNSDHCSSPMPSHSSFEAPGSSPDYSYNHPNSSSDNGCGNTRGRYNYRKVGSVLLKQ